MTRRKSFATYRPSDSDPIEVEINTETFRFRPQLPGIDLLEFVGGFESTDDLAVIGAVNKLFKTAVLDEDKSKFETYIHEPTNFVGLGTLVDVATWLLECYSNDHPTKQSTPSTPGSELNGAGSVDERVLPTDATSLP